MIAVDTNILVYAHREDAPFHTQALQRLAQLGGQRWAIPWPCVHEFLAIVTHPRVFNPPSPVETAFKAVAGWRESSTLVVIGELEGYWELLEALLRAGLVAGPRVHDARIAAICLQHGVKELWTADRDFSRFPQLKTHNPLV